MSSLDRGQTSRNRLPISVYSFQTAAGLAALEGTGINPGALGIFKMEQRDDCVYDLSGNCFDDGTLESLPPPSEVQVLGPN